jgi:hypothetical protein
MWQELEVTHAQEGDERASRGPVPAVAVIHQSEAEVVTRVCMPY